jgi:hypothetical protein
MAKKKRITIKTQGWRKGPKQVDMTHPVTKRREKLERARQVQSMLEASVKPEPKEFQRVPVPPAALCNNVRDYFIAMLGYPYEMNRIEELREEYTLDSVVGEACRKIIEAAAVLNREIAFTCGKGDPKIVEIRAITLYVCEVLAFG